MVRSKYIADQAVETARLCVLKASEAEREAMKKKQEAEQALVNTGFAVQAGIDTARAGYKAAHAGQIATVMGQQAAVWEDPNLPPQDTIRQLEYVTRLIDSVIDKANEVTYKALLLAFAHEENGSLTDQAKKWAGHQTFVRRQVNITTRNLANILANRTTKEKEKLSVINSEAEHVYKVIDGRKFDTSLNDPTKTPAENESEVLSQRLLMTSQPGKAVVSIGELRDLIPDMVKLALQQVAMANHICALTAWRISRVRLKKGIQGQIDTTHSQLLCEQEALYIGEIAHSAANKAINVFKCIGDLFIALNKLSKKTLSIGLILDKDEQVKQLHGNIDMLLKYRCSTWEKDHPCATLAVNNGLDGTSSDIGKHKNDLAGHEGSYKFTVDKDSAEVANGANQSESRYEQCKFQNLDELMVQVSQAIDIAASQADELIHKALIYQILDDRKADDDQGSSDTKISGCKEMVSVKNSIEDLMDQISTLASRSAILAYQEHIAIWGEYSESEKDNPQALKAVAQQASDIAGDAARAAERAFQAANSAGQAVTTLIHQFTENYQINHYISSAHTVHSSSLQTEDVNLSVQKNIDPIIDDTEQFCCNSNVACNNAINVYEKIEQERRYAEQACKRGAIAAQSVSWWPIWPWSKLGFPFTKLRWLEPSNSFKQSAEAAKQASESVDHVGHAAVLAGQAVAQSGQAVTQASLAVAMVGQMATQIPDSYCPSSLQEVISTTNDGARRVGTSVSWAAQTVEQAGQVADHVAEAAQNTEKVANIAQAVQQVEWLRMGRQKWIFGLGVFLSLVSIVVLLFMIFLSKNNVSIVDSWFAGLPWNNLIRWIIPIVIVLSIVDSYLLFTCLVENIKKITRMPHRILTLLCCALLLLLSSFTATYFFTFGARQYITVNGVSNPGDVNRIIQAIAQSGTFSHIAAISSALLIILPPLITGIVYYQHCTLNDLHPHEVLTSTLES